MTDGNLMDADCIHGKIWWECPACDEDIRNDLQARADRPEPEPIGCTFIIFRGAITGRVITCGACAWCKEYARKMEAPDAAG